MPNLTSAKAPYRRPLPTPKSPLLYARQAPLTLSRHCQLPDGQGGLFWRVGEEAGGTQCHQARREAGPWPARARPLRHSRWRQSRQRLKTGAVLFCRCFARHINSVRSHPGSVKPGSTLFCAGWFYADLDGAFNLGA